MIGAIVLGIVAGYLGRPLMFDLGGLIASPASTAYACRPSRPPWQRPHRIGRRLK